MTAVPTMVFVVDDDESVRRGLDRLLRAAGHRVEVFASVQEFLDRPEHDGPRCLVLDVRMPGQDGLDLHRRLEADGRDIPVIFMTGDADLPFVPRTTKAETVDCLAKPFEDAELLDATGQALERDRQRWESRRDFPTRA